METFLLVFVVLVLVFANFYLVYRTHIKPMRQDEKNFEKLNPTQFPPRNSVGDNEKRK